MPTVRMMGAKPVRQQNRVSSAAPVSVGRKLFMGKERAARFDSQTFRHGAGAAEFGDLQSFHRAPLGNQESPRTRHRTDGAERNDSRNSFARDRSLACSTVRMDCKN